MFGMNGAEVSGRPFAVMVHPDDRKTFEATLAEALKASKTQKQVDFRLQVGKKILPVSGHLWVQPARGVLPGVARLLVGVVTRPETRPATAAPAAKAAAAKTRTVAADAHKALRGTERLLVVDDQPEQRGPDHDRGRRLLRVAGKRRVERSNRGAAFERLVCFRPARL